MVNIIETIEYQKTEPKIKLIKGQRDNYGWEITLPKPEGQSNEHWISELKHLNDELLNTFTQLNKMEDKDER